MSKQDFKFQGVIAKIFDKQSGTSSNGAWESIEFLVTEPTGVEYPQSVVFRMFGIEKVSSFLQYNKVGKLVDVSFNFKANESASGRWFNGIQAWKVFGAQVEEVVAEAEIKEAEEEDLPF